MASPMWRMNGRCSRMAGVLLLSVLVLSTQVLCQDDVVTDALEGTTAALTAADDGVVDAADAPDAGAAPSDAPVAATPGAADESLPVTVGPVVIDDAGNGADDAETTVAPSAGTVEETTVVHLQPNLGKNVGQGGSQDDSSSSSSSSSSGSSVFVGILVSGLLAALAITVGYFKCQRRPEKTAVRLAEEAYPVDQENQGNTLVSVAPLNPPPETPEKPSVNGESPEATKTQTPPPTNGHSTAKAADTEL